MSDLTSRDRAAAFGARYLMRPLLALPLPWAVHRVGFEVLAPPPRRRGGLVETATRHGGIPCREISPTAPRGTLLWVHGGGFVLGSSKAYRAMGYGLARATGFRVVLPDYRLAPEHPFPAGPKDVLAVFRALAQGGPVALGGDSAGGTLALSACATLLAEGPAPARLVLVCPAVDLNPARPVPDHDEMVLPVAMLRRVVADYLDGHSHEDPDVSPLHASFAGAPPTLIQCARREILEGDSDAMAAKLRSEGVDVTLQKTGGVPHVWHLFAGYTPAADAAIGRIADFLAQP